MGLIRFLQASCVLTFCLILNKSEATDATVPGFRAPSLPHRPKFRYWLPDASVPHQSVIDDVNHIASVGGGGLEFLPFYNYGLGPALTDWSVYGFGTEAFLGILEAALNASAVHNLAFDLAMGPNQGAGVPSMVETTGLAKELVHGNISLASGETYNGPVPPPDVEYNKLTGFMNAPETWGSNELVAVVAGKIVSEIPLAEYFSMSVLDETSLVDLTNLTVQNNLSWTAPEGNGTWVVFAIYERYTNQRSCVSVSNATTALGNGSWVVDHWSASGAKKMTDFWDNQILSHEAIASLVAQVGQYAWEDSMEIQAALPWTSDMLTRFETLHGYSITKYLPILFHATNAWGGYLPPYNITYTFGEYMTDGGPYVQDYKKALSTGYLEYLDHYARWASSNGLKLSNQPAYNMPVDMAAAIPHVQVPELESLGFAESINKYRQFTGPAHLAGRNTISTEVGAVRGSAYKQRVPELRGLLDGSFAAGVNVMVIHGYAYGGEYVGTTWPGYTPFQYEFSEMWSPRQPAWRHLDDLMSYAARNSMVMKSGVPKVDIAFYYFEVPYRSGASVYPGDDINAAGYTFEYLGPENLASDQAIVTDGVLSKDGPGYKALVIYNQTQITPNASAALVNFAQHGLPIYIVGTIPNTTVGTKGQQEVSANMAKVLELETVHVWSLEDFSASTLIIDEVVARVRSNGNSSASNLYTFWTSNTESQSDYVFLYNLGTENTFDLSFKVPPDATPVILNAWNGEQIPLAEYQTTSDGITTQVSLKSNQTTIIAFQPSSGAKVGVHAVAHSSNIEAVRFVGRGSLEVWVNGTSEAWVDLSNGTRVTVSSIGGSDDELKVLGPWNLSVEAYGPSANNDTEGNKKTIDIGTLDNLAPWTKISGIENVSGIGTYVAQFEWSKDNHTGAIISFGPVLNTLRAWVNGQQIFPVDPAYPTADISDFVVEGTNDVRIEVTTTLFNAIKANIDQVFSIGHGPQTPTFYTGEDWHEFGLIGPVEIRTLRKILVA